ncbi:MAG: hypothetical protein LBD48_00565 [Treponema sp.]|nr:hypothetical protein [Treponema sp.]
MKKIFLLVTLLNTLIIPAFAEGEFLLGLAPVFAFPAGDENFGPGIGAAAALDWVFWNFPAGRKSGASRTGQFGMGLSAGGGFTGLQVKDGSLFSLWEGNFGPFVRWRPFDRWTFRFDVRAGLYQYQWDRYSNNRPLAGESLEAELHLTPFVSLFAKAGITHYGFTGRPLNSLNGETGIRLNLSEIMNGPARLRGEKTGQFRVLPVLYSWYKDNPVAVIRITNEEPNTVTSLVPQKGQICL